MKKLWPLFLLVLVAVSAQWWLPRAEPGPAPPGMVLVPAGRCWIGTDDPRADEASRPRRQVYVRAFYIDKNEITNAEVKAVKPEFVYPPGRESYPAVGLLRPEAEEVLARLGKRLPTGVEWEKAARGTDGRTFPWGEAPLQGRANVGKIQANTCNSLKMMPVGSFPQGASPYGCLDMIGNAFEWCSDDDPGPPVHHILRGGAIGYPDRYNRTYALAVEERGVT